MSAAERVLCDAFGVTTPPTAYYELPWGDRLGLLVAAVPWELLRGALRELGVETEVRGPVAAGMAWDDDWSGDGVPVLAGELADRTYVYDPSGIVGGLPDEVVALAARTGAFVLGYSYDDTTGLCVVTAAQGPELLRYVWSGGPPYEHAEGAPLPGETAEAPLESSAGVRRVLTAEGFAVEGPAGWQALGAKWDVRWLAPDPDRQPEAHRRRCFGPLRARTIALERASCEATFGPEAAAAYDELDEFFPSPESPR